MLLPLPPPHQPKGDLQPVEKAHDSIAQAATERRNLAFANGGRTFTGHLLVRACKQTWLRWFKPRSSQRVLYVSSSSRVHSLKSNHDDFDLDAELRECAASRAGASRTL